MAWSFDDGSKVTPLFDHEIDVGPGDTAFSKGTSKGSLLQGRYRIDLTLGDAKATAAFMVLSSSTTPAGTAPASTALLVFAATSAPPSPPAPPQSGDSGTIPPQNGTGTGGSAGCHIALTGGSGLYATLDTSGCGGDVTTGAAGGETGALTVIDPGIQGDNLRFWSVDPCKVGGSDLPGSTIRYVAEVTKGTDKGLRRELSATVSQDKSPPGITFTSTPGPGDFALPGTTIDLQAQAFEVGSGVGASGIADITVTDPNGKTIGHAAFDGPKACDAARLTGQASAAYAVPQGAPPIVELTITAKDFAGNTASMKARYSTEPVWNGFILAKTVATSASYRCRQTWQATFEITAKDGAISGSGAAEPLAPTSCQLAGPASIVATHEEFSVSGTFDGKVFKLEFTPTGGEGFDTGFHVLWFPKPVTIKVPWGVGTATHSGTNDLSISNSVGELAGVPATATLDGYIQLLLKNQ